MPQEPVQATVPAEQAPAVQTAKPTAEAPKPAAAAETPKPAAPAEPAVKEPAAAEQGTTQATELTAELATGTSVENREIVGASSKFPSNIGKVWCLSNVKGSKITDTVTHEWYYKDKKMASVELKIGPWRWITWSNMNIWPAFKGDWTVKVVDSKGNLINSINFKIEDTETAPATPAAK
jgi:hypothetical protein